MDRYHQVRDILLPILVFFGLVLYRQVTQMRKARHLKEIAPLINGEVSIRPFSSPKIKGTHMGMPFQISFTHPGKGTRGLLEVTFGYPCPFTLEIRPRGLTPRLAELLSRGTFIETGDEQIDETYVIKAGSHPEKAAHYLRNTVNQELIKHAIDLEIAMIRYSEKGITLAKPGSYLEGNLTSDELARYLAFAARLGERF